MKTTNIILLFLTFLTHAIAQTTSENYIRTITPLLGTTSEVVVNLTTNKKEEIHYMDGLGRETQIVYKKATPNGSDLVQPISYDQYGRQPITYLNYADPTNDGSYKTNALENQATFYQNAPRVAHSNYAYSQNVFDNSPLNRIIEQSAPGADWQLGSNHTTKINYRTNYTNEVKSWEINTNTMDAFSTSCYAATTLFVSEITDEQGYSSLQYKDKAGRVILIKKQIGARSTTVERAMNPIQNTTPVYQETYYVYDWFGNLSVVIPPKAMELMNTSRNYNTAALTEDLIFNYQYDERKRLTQKKVPGAGWLFYIYNTLDQLVLTQDAEQRVNQQWMFFKYDILGRVIMTGLFDALQYGIAEGAQPSGENLFNYWKAVINGYPLSEKRSDALYSIHQGYTNGAFPQLFTNLQSVTYYDDYDFDNNGNPDNSFRASAIPCITVPPTPGGLRITLCSPYTNTPSSRTHGKVTSSKIKILDPASAVQWLTSVNFYDEKGQSIQTQTNNQFGGTDVIDYVYDFSGKVVHTAYEHRKTRTAPAITILNKYVYDQGERLINVYQQNNNDAPVLLAQNVYNELGQLIEENLHKKNAAAPPLQSIDYAYNIRSWLTHINNSDLTNDRLASGGSLENVYYNDDNNDLWGMEINYNQPNTELSNNALFNGNISQVQWQSATDNVKRGYAYQYNPLSWLTMATYKEYNTTAQAWTQNVGKFDVLGITYDANGNINRMKQNGLLSNTTFGEMDNLTYNYSGNRLLSVNDSATLNGINDFRDNDIHNTTEYTYDNNGNCLTDANKGTTTSYNHLHLPTKITFANGNKIEYTYAADGTRLRKKATNYHRMSYNTYYSGSLVYSDYGLDFISTSKGRIVPIARGTQQFRYEYNYRDQVGNTRLVFSDLNNDGVIDKYNEVLQQASYYPFGLEFKGLMTTQIGPENKFKFNGKELDDDFGLQHYDFHARAYNPQLGRMNGVDPLAKFELTPTHFCSNNPINRIDPTGMSDFTTEENKLGGGPPDWMKNILSPHMSNGFKVFNLPGGGFKEAKDETPAEKESRIAGGNLEALGSSSHEGGPGGGAGWIGPANTWNGGFGTLAGVAENLSGKLSIGTNCKLYPSGWGGNQFVSTAKVARVGKVLGGTTLVAGTVFDAYGVYNYYKNGANDPNAVHPRTAGTNLGIGLWGLLSPANAIGGAAYYGIDTFYPGGFPGAMRDQMNLNHANQVINPNWQIWPGAMKQ